MNPKCPRHCDPEYMTRHPERDTIHSHAYVCLACGKVIHVFIVRPRSEEKAERIDKYGTPEDI